MWWLLQKRKWWKKKGFHANIILTHCKSQYKLALKLYIIPDSLLSILHKRIYI